ncbi:MAG: hypothetical protein H0V68_10640 [Actinobacteria bacterium]|nr:hypothetical protein [Actinomycetota bacterium]
MTRALATSLLSVALIALGVVILVETAVVDGRAGYLLGALLVVAGTLRLYLARR